MNSEQITLKLSEYSDLDAMLLIASEMAHNGESAKLIANGVREALNKMGLVNPVLTKQYLYPWHGNG